MSGTRRESRWTLSSSAEDAKLQSEELELQHKDENINGHVTTKILLKIKGKISHLKNSFFIGQVRKVRTKTHLKYGLGSKELYR